MDRQTRSSIAIGLCLLTLLSGCQPQQPFFFREDGDLSHYVDVATDIEYADVQSPTLAEVEGAAAPLTIANSENFDMWDLTLQEVTRLTLENSQVVRGLGGRITDGGQNITATSPQVLSQNGGSAVVTTYDPALVESGPGTATGSPFSGTGVEAALAEFDAQLDTSITWNNNDRPQNFGLRGPGLEDFFAPQFRQDLGGFTAGITKQTASGGTVDFRNNTDYDQNNNGSRLQPSDWFTNFEMGFTQPLLAGRGTQVNRIAGPQTFQQVASGFANNIDGVIISRIRHDVTLADFEIAVRDLMRDVEDAYWELYFAYRDLEARKIGRDSALATWQKIKALQDAGGEGGEADKEAQARSQYYLFRSQVETALTNLFRVENRLRFMMGLTHSDGRLIRPIDEPTTAQVHFDWTAVHCEALTRRAEVRRQQWQVKRREMELIAARNELLPRLDLGGRYRWLGAGDDLINSNRNGLSPFAEGSTAFESLTSGDYQEWQIDLQFTMPIGFRRAMSGVRHHQLLLARERAVLQDLELQMSHNLADAERDLQLNYGVAKTNFNRRVASEDEVDAVEAVYDSGTVTLDLLLDAQRRRAEAESAYYRSLVDYNRAIMLVHYNKGSLLEYNGVYLAEGPWPGKAYFDALRRARQRDASIEIDYGYSRPRVLSRGPYSGAECCPGAPALQEVPSTAIPLTPSPNGDGTPAIDPVDAPDVDVEPIPAPVEEPSASVVADPQFAPVNYEAPLTAEAPWHSESPQPLPAQPLPPQSLPPQSLPAHSLHPPAGGRPLPLPGAVKAPDDSAFQTQRVPKDLVFGPPTGTLGVGQFER